jgi:hypothetical protein
VASCGACPDRTAVRCAVAWTARGGPRLEELLVLFLLFGFDEPELQQKAPKAPAQKGKGKAK